MLEQQTKIAITGIAGGGKTVFLTSLLSHLSEFNQANFPIRNNIRISDFQELPITDRKWKAFNSDSFRLTMSSGKWPKKTTDATKYKCKFTRSDWKKSLSLNRFTSQVLEFLDFPGERVADGAIAGIDSYERWSERILDYYSDNHEYSLHLNSYLHKLDSAESLSIEDLVTEYKVLLGELINNYKPLISPSTFLLSQDGSVAKRRSAQELSESRFCGVDATEEFAPLPQSILKSRPEVLEAFTKSYTKYRKEIALPLFKEIVSSEVLIILIDIPAILAGGVDRYNDNRQILLDLFTILHKGSFVGQLIHKITSYFTGNIKRVAFVASKSDMVLPHDIENGYLIGLLKQMTNRAKQMHPEIDFEWFNCSACHSTKQSSRSNHLIGKLSINNSENDWHEYPVPLLPELWPSTWSPGDFPFYNIQPNAPRNSQIPPKQEGLERLFEFITGVK